MPVVSVTKVIRLTERQIQQACADWVRHRCGYPADPGAVEVAGDADGRAVARVAVGLTVYTKEVEVAGG